MTERACGQRNEAAATCAMTSFTAHGAEQTAHTIRARARDRRGDACVRPLQRLKLGAQHLIRLSVMTDIPAVQGRPQPVEQDHIDTY